MAISDEQPGPPAAAACAGGLSEGGELSPQVPATQHQHSTHPSSTGSRGRWTPCCATRSKSKTCARPAARVGWFVGVCVGPGGHAGRESPHTPASNVPSLCCITHTLGPVELEEASHPLRRVHDRHPIPRGERLRAAAGSSVRCAPAPAAGAGKLAWCAAAHGHVH